MVLPGSGQTITMNQINLEISSDNNHQTCWLAGSDFRTLAGVASGTIRMTDFHGKSANPNPHNLTYPDFTDVVVNIGTVKDNQRTAAGGDRWAANIIIGHLDVNPADYLEMSVRYKGGGVQHFGYWAGNGWTAIATSPPPHPAHPSGGWRGVWNGRNWDNAYHARNGFNSPSGISSSNGWKFYKEGGYPNKWRIFTWKADKQIEHIILNHVGNAWGGAKHVVVQFR